MKGLGLAIVCALLFTACSDELFNPVDEGYGRVSINIAGGGAPQHRTTFPSAVFEKYEYRFTNANTGRLIKEESRDPGNDGLFTLEIGDYTVEVKAYIGDDTLVASGHSSKSFNVSRGKNTLVKVWLSGVFGGLPGEFTYTIEYPEGGTAAVTLQKWPDLTDISLDPVTHGSGITQTLQLDPGSYLLSVEVTKGVRYFAGISESVHIYSALTTSYRQIFDDLLSTPLKVIDIPGILGVTVPAVGGAPAAIIIENEQYSGTVTWSPAGTTFDRATVYTATITLAPKEGYTLEGVPADFFTVAGAASVRNDADSGVITAVFPLTTADFGYTRTIESIVLPPGTYLLEVWGAQGGLSGHGIAGGLGGYSRGEITLSSSTTVFICVGQMSPDQVNGGWNGGGNGGINNDDSAPGGGATHIATRTGLLRDLENFKSSVLIVAGGGGGSGCIDSNGGAGGGLNGEMGRSGMYGPSGGGGTQDTGGAGGTNSQSGSFGQGGNTGTTREWPGGGGGGGWYGGGAGSNLDDGGSPGGGGSGYIGGVANGTSTPGINLGHGQARISYIGP